VTELNLDLTASWLIGDSTTDLETARRAGVRSLLVRTGHAGRDGKYAVQPDFVFDNLETAVEFIVAHDH
jgi:phosphoglycolate phosphatase-like HAD superfamily hydrolase